MSATVISARVLNRTLLQRQHLLDRVDVAPLAMVEYLLGLQAQDVLPPYLSLAARLSDFDPFEISKALESRAAVRILAMRGTIHLMTAADCVALRPLVQPMLTKLIKNTEWGRGTPESVYDVVAEQGRTVLAAGPMTPKALGEELRLVLGDLAPERSANDLSHLVRHLVPLVQIPPRGLWKTSGGQNYVTAETWLEQPLASEPGLAEAIRRYLRAFGPATAADITTWSGVRGIRPVLTSMGDELVAYRDEAGRPLVDLAGLPLADADLPAPPRLLGTYDNVWLSHDDRTRVTQPDKRKRWMGTNGGVGRGVFVDGTLEGLWFENERAVSIEMFRKLTKAEKSALDDEVSRVAEFLAR